MTENLPRSLQGRRLQGTENQEATRLEQSQIGSRQIAKKTVKFSLFRTVATILHVAIKIKLIKVNCSVPQSH